MLEHEIKSTTYKWHVFLTQIHHRLADSVTVPDKSEEDGQRFWRKTFHNSQLEMLKSNFLDNRLSKRKNRFLFDYRFSHCTIPPR